MRGRAREVAVRGVGLVSAVGLSARSTCAAIRAKVTNPQLTRYVDRGGGWVMAQQVSLSSASRGTARLACMAAMAAEEALADRPHASWHEVPVLLCVAEPGRAGRDVDLDELLWTHLRKRLDCAFAAGSVVIAQGRTAVATALDHARTLLAGQSPRVLIVAADSLLSGRTLEHYLHHDRVLTERHSDGFIPGEGAAALLLGPADSQQGLVCTGIGFGDEPAHIDSGLPLRGDGMADAFKRATSEAGWAMHDFDYRIADLSGEQYYFKEADLALTRTLRQRKPEFEIWHPAECIGEAGAVVGGAIVALADAAGRGGYAPGPRVLTHLSGDDGRRAAIAFEYRG